MKNRRKTNDFVRERLERLDNMVARAVKEVR